MFEKERVFDFLQVLNHDIDEVRGQLLCQAPANNPRSLVEVRREESYKWVMIITPSSSQPDLHPLGSALATNRGIMAVSWKPRSRWCNHYKKPYHIKETCRKLYGKLANRKS